MEMERYAIIAPFDGETFEDINSISIEFREKTYRYSNLAAVRNKGSHVLPTVLMFSDCDEVVVCGGAEVGGE